MSKRKLRQLVEQNYVSGWDDPRMPTLCGLRRRGYTSHSIRDFCERIGVAKSANTVEYALLEQMCIRDRSWTHTVHKQCCAPAPPALLWSKASTNRLRQPPQARQSQ